MVAEIDAAKEAGDSLGGVVEVVATGLPIGLGSHIQWDTKLSTKLMAAVGSVNAVKGVEFGAALSALDRLTERIQQGTRLDLALLRGQEALDRTPRVDGSRPVLILLTDGLPNRVPTPEGGGTQEDTVRAAADRAKDAGTRIFTIGLGQDDDVLSELLTEVASTPLDYYFAPDGEDLAGIYRQIAGRIDECP